MWLSRVPKAMGVIPNTANRMQRQNRRNRKGRKERRGERSEEEYLHRLSEPLPYVYLLFLLIFSIA